MRFLCLHGAIGSIENISIQLGPLRKEMETDNAASFHYINAPLPVSPPQEFDKYFGVGPYYRWIDDGGVAENTVISRVRKSPIGETPEDMMRDLMGDSPVFWHNHQSAMDYLYDTLEENPDIEGVIGYSEGASVAASLILDEQRKLWDTGRPRRIKCAVFFTGWPPVSSDGDFMLSDERDILVDVPSLHVVGAYDPFRYGAFALYNTCDPNNAIMFDTGKGHTLPRSGPVIQELGEAMRTLIGRAYS
ncbi:hypothetical protein MW887_001583 [Aspergillus wentii]|nr:hypothetical protein MW887_001583 [Aspergillus wentii]